MMSDACWSSIPLLTEKVTNSESSFYGFIMINLNYFEITKLKEAVPKF